MEVGGFLTVEMYCIYIEVTAPKGAQKMRGAAERHMKVAQSMSRLLFQRRRGLCVCIVFGLSDMP
jgi:hypothetical protein